MVSIASPDVIYSTPYSSSYVTFSSYDASSSYATPSDYVTSSIYDTSLGYATYSRYATSSSYNDFVPLATNSLPVLIISLAKIMSVSIAMLVIIIIVLLMGLYLTVKKKKKGMIMVQHRDYTHLTFIYQQVYQKIQYYKPMKHMVVYLFLLVVTYRLTLLTRAYQWHYRLILFMSKLT